MNKLDLKRLILESLEELKTKDQEDDEENRDLGQEPLYIASKDKYLLFDEDEPEENVNILELGAELEDGTPVCEGCLVAYMNEQHSLLTEAEYRGRKIKLGKPMQGDVKKFKVFVRDPKTGNVKKVNFGDPNMRIKKSNPKRRKSFRARHKCATAKDRTSARYWSCRAWE